MLKHHIQHAAEFVFPPGWRLGEHVHRAYHELIVVTEGGIDVQTPAQSIASLVGLGDDAHFSRVYRRVAGSVPSAVRRAGFQPASPRS